MGAEQSSDVGPHVRIVVGDQDMALHLDSTHVEDRDVPLRDREFRRGVLGQPTQCFFDIGFGAGSGGDIRRFKNQGDLQTAPTRTEC